MVPIKPCRDGFHIRPKWRAGVAAPHIKKPSPWGEGAERMRGG